MQCDTGTFDADLLTNKFMQSLPGKNNQNKVGKYPDYKQIPKNNAKVYALLSLICLRFSITKIPTTQYITISI